MPAYNREDTRKRSLLWVACFSLALCVHMFALICFHRMALPESLKAPEGGIALLQTAFAPAEEAQREERELALAFEELSAPALEEKALEVELLPPGPVALAPLPAIQTPMPAFSLPPPEPQWQEQGPHLQAPVLALELPDIATPISAAHGSLRDFDALPDGELAVGWDRGNLSAFTGDLRPPQLSGANHFPSPLPSLASFGPGFASAGPDREAGALSFDDEARASNEDFEVTAACAPRSDGKGFVFSLSLSPRKGVAFKRIAQNYFFLLDRSNSISSRRYKHTCAGVRRALDFIPEGDTFNIHIFDRKVTSLALENLLCNEENRERARQFLKEQANGAILALTDLYGSLGRIVPQEVAEEQINTAFLLSDGDTFLNAQNQRKTIGQWTRQNQNRVNLYCVAAGWRNNLPLLDLISAFNGGALYYVGELEELDEALPALVASVSKPIGKNLQVTAVCQEPGVKLRLLPPSHQLPPLYEGKPLVIYGTCNKLTAFTVFFQGTHYDRLLHIAQTVDLAAAAPAEADLERKWAQKKAYFLYDRHIQEGLQEPLSRAEELIERYHLPVAFH